MQDQTAYGSEASVTVSRQSTYERLLRGAIGNVDDFVAVSSSGINKPQHPVETGVLISKDLQQSRRVGNLVPNQIPAFIELY